MQSSISSQNSPAVSMTTGIDTKHDPNGSLMASVFRGSMKSLECDESKQNYCIIIHFIMIVLVVFLVLGIELHNTVVRGLENVSYQPDNFMSFIY